MSGIVLLEHLLVVKVITANTLGPFLEHRHSQVKALLDVGKAHALTFFLEGL